MRQLLVEQVAQQAELVGIAQLVGLDDLVGRDAERAVDRVLVGAAARLGAGPARPAGIVVAGARHHLAIGLGIAILFGVALGAVGGRPVHRGLRPRRGGLAAVAHIVALGFLALALIVVGGGVVELAKFEIEVLDQPAGRARIGILIGDGALEFGG